MDRKDFLLAAFARMQVTADRMSLRSSDKILTLDQLRARLVPRATRLVHCHGCFDFLHVGHMHHFEFAKGLGDLLLVSTNDDVHFPDKGPGRPLFPEGLRARAIAAIAAVDFVLVYPGFVPDAIFTALRPDVYVKGIEYHPDRLPAPIPEEGAVRAYGGAVMYGPSECIFSSSELIGRLRRTINREAAA